ncbi:MAG: hypothetical protein M0Z75_15440 [Nitrospiraceae bacterium]|nr:hypothetical protein [Nitrospiraceae bacterium]MDA8090386.1 hypothetical protein [Nitrospiraceae bacterium]
MTTTLIIIGIFAGFFFLVVRPLQKRSGKYDVELPEEEFGAGSLDPITDPGLSDIPGNIFNDD